MLKDFSKDHERFWKSDSATDMGRGQVGVSEKTRDEQHSVYTIDWFVYSLGSATTFPNRNNDWTWRCVIIGARTS